MKATIYQPNKPETNFLELSEVPKPEFSPIKAIIKVNGCGVCGSDLLKLDRSLIKEGTILGHEMVGEIHEISAQLSKKYGFKRGDRIVSSHHVPCGTCNYCLNEQESLCTEFKSSNFTPGAFCEYLEITEGHLAKTVQRIPDHISNEEASFTEPIACCLKAIHKSGIPNHMGTTKAIVIGLGSIGNIIGQLAGHYLQHKISKGQAEVIGVDLLKSKRKLAENISSTGFTSTTDSLNDEKADFIFLAAGSKATVQLALDNIKDGGTIIVFSSYDDRAPKRSATEVQEQSLQNEDECSGLPAHKQGSNEQNAAIEPMGDFFNNEIYFRELKVMGSYSPNLENLHEALKLLDKGHIQVKDLITHRANLSNLGETITKSKEELGIKVYLEL